MANKKFLRQKKNARGQREKSPCKRKKFAAKGNKLREKKKDRDKKKNCCSKRK